MGNAGVAVGAAARREGFEEPTHAHLTLGLHDSGADFLCVLPWWTLGVGTAGIGIDATARCEGFEESNSTNITLGLGGGGAGYLCVLPRWTLGVVEAPFKRTTYW